MNLLTFPKRPPMTVENAKKFSKMGYAKSEVILITEWPQSQFYPFCKKHSLDFKVYDLKQLRRRDVRSVHDYLSQGCKQETFDLVRGAWCQ